jgi:hypothetical protein
VQRRGLGPRDVGGALGGTSGRTGDGHLALGGLEDLQDDPHRSRLAGAGSAGDDADALRKRDDRRVPLAAVQDDAQVQGRLLDEALGLLGRFDRGLGLGHQHGDAFRDLAFVAEQRDRVDEVRDRIERMRAPVCHLVELGPHGVGSDADLAGHGLDQQGRRQPAMPALARPRVEEEAQRRPDPLRIAEPVSG